MTCTDSLPIRRIIAFSVCFRFQKLCVELSLYLKKRGYKHEYITTKRELWSSIDYVLTSCEGLTFDKVGRGNIHYP